MFFKLAPYCLAVNATNFAYLCFMNIKFKNLLIKIYKQLVFTEILTSVNILTSKLFVSIDRIEIFLIGNDLSEASFKRTVDIT